MPLRFHGNNESEMVSEIYKHTIQLFSQKYRKIQYTYFGIEVEPFFFVNRFQHGLSLFVELCHEHFRMAREHPFPFSI